MLFDPSPLQPSQLHWRRAQLSQGAQRPPLARARPPPAAAMSADRARPHEPQLCPRLGDNANAWAQVEPQVHRRRHDSEALPPCAQLPAILALRPLRPAPHKRHELLALQSRKATLCSSKAAASGANGLTSSQAAPIWSAVTRTQLPAGASRVSTQMAGPTTGTKRGLESGLPFNTLSVTRAISWSRPPEDQRRATPETRPMARL